MCRRVAARRRPAQAPPIVETTDRFTPKACTVIKTLQSGSCSKNSQPVILARVVERLLLDENGASSAEYAITLAIIAAAVAAALSQFDLAPAFASLSGIVRSALGL